MPNDQRFDDQDYLAMVALQFITKLLEYEDKQDISPIIEKIKELDVNLGEYIALEKE